MLLLRIIIYEICDIYMFLLLDIFMIKSFGLALIMKDGSSRINFNLKNNLVLEVLD